MADTNYLNRRLQLDFEGADEDVAYTTKGVNAVACSFNGSAKLEATGAITGTTSLYCDGVDSYLSIPDDLDRVNFGRDVFCFEFDFKSGTGSGPGADVILVSKGNEGSDESWRFYYNNSANALYFYHSWNTTASYSILFDFDTDAAGAIDLFDGSVHRIAVYRVSSGRIYISVDGNVASSNSLTTPYPLRHNADPILVGAGEESGVITKFVEGFFDNMRCTIGVTPYSATSGTFSVDTAPFDLVDPGAAASYGYPLALEHIQKDAESLGKFPWVASTELGFTNYAMFPITAANGGPTPQAGSQSFCVGATSGASGGPTNATYGSALVDLDFSRYDEDFLTDVDAGLLKVVMGAYGYLENSGDGLFNLRVEFYSEGGALIAAADSGGRIPAAASWGYFEEQVRIPVGTRSFKFYAQGKKGTNFYSDTRYFMDSMVYNIDEQGYGAGYSHVTSYFASVDDMVSDWTSDQGSVVKLDSTTSQNKYFGEAAYANSGFGTNVDCYSPQFDLVSDGANIDAGDVDYYFRMFMANDVDTCDAWVEFYESDGVTLVGSRVTSASTTRLASGEIVELSGTIPSGARKAVVGTTTVNGASGSRFYARDPWFMEVGPAASGAAGGQGVISTIVIAG
jgi:hypothetical protein